MAGWRSLLHGLRVLTHRRDADRDVDDELAHFLDEAAAEQEARGLSKDDAARAVRREAGDAVRVREQVRDGGWEHAVSTWLADLRLAGRMLRRSPVFTLVVVAVVALGSGAVTTVFSAMNALVLRPISGVADPARLVSVRPARRDGSTDEQISYPLYRYLRESSTTLSHVAAWGRVALTISTGGSGVPVQGAMVTDTYFPALGVRPVAGRFFTPDEVRVTGSAPLLVISERLWREQLDAAPAVIGMAVTVNGHPFTIVGVAPDDFAGVYTGMVVDAWVPLTMQPQLRPRSSLEAGSWTWVFGRLAGEAAVAAAQAELSTALEVRERSQGVRREDGYVSARLEPLTGLPGGEGRGLMSFMALLLAAAGLVLLIAGVNVASMLSARHLSRSRELAVRAALGAGRGRLVRHLLTEIALLFAAGALGGYAIAVLATAALERLPLPDNIPVTLELSPDLRVLAFALTVSLMAGLVFGLGPSLTAARKDITTRLREESAGGGMRRGRLRRILIAAQLACSLVLLVSASLFYRAFEAGRKVDVGFEREHVAVVWLEPESWGYDEARARGFYTRLAQSVATLPGVTASTTTGRLPLMLSSSVDEVLSGDARLRVHSAAVGAGYFETLRLPLVRGRGFAAADTRQSAPVAVVNEEMAARLWPGADPLGRTFQFREQLRTVVGVARNAKYASLDEELPPFAYFPVSQVWQPTQVLLVRVTPGVRHERTLQDAVRALDPRLPVPKVTTMERATGIALLPQRAAATVMAALGGIGLLLAAVGLYGVMAFSTARRTREIGIRIALGATRSSVTSLVLREALTLTGAGIVVGLALAAAATRLLSRWLLNVSPFDAAAFAATTALLAATALAASYIPARRATSVDPLLSLKVE
jgi:predicted permease